MKKLLYSGFLALTMVCLAAGDASAQTKVVTHSRARKNTAIGAAAGAATGAVVSHKKGKGAVIGGVVGAGAGYIYGKHRDKKKGKIVKVKNAD
ncbi:glycine zipper 2TM domain-containing protein [Flaviaesturariibacter flavus]|uniref:Glycine zipper 2TM domain-containing protein n=1 Tax=Flaviaesturariibacter flavus TaxID=2502780 RepID=A0A4R1B807_9BACT|nr:YMGG-like glycine zipper-containing protein [Flaviaesturariibacter flavus]TCJ13367.1 glycine zipper 2TM domain-containing protein [Flaviaesturariibacter flavus]